MAISYLNKLKKYTAIALTPLILGYGSLTNIACVKRIPIENFIKTDAIEKITEKKEEETKEYKINNINYSAGALEISINEIAKKGLFSIGTKETYDLYDVGSRKELDSKKTGLTVGILGGLTTSIIGLISILNPPVTESCMDYQTSKGLETICSKKEETPTFGYISLFLGTGAFIGIGYGVSKIKKVYNEDKREEKRNVKKEDVKNLDKMEVLHEKPAVDISVGLNSDYFSFDGKNNITLSTDKKGIARTKIKAKSENFTFTKGGLYNIKLIKDARDLGMDDLVKKAMESAKEVEYPLTIKIQDEEETIALKGYEIPESKLEELMQ